MYIFTTAGVTFFSIGASEGTPALNKLSEFGNDEDEKRTNIKKVIFFTI